ncbi:hypothetical protein Hypma_002132 [Hypsizygus marmoreus]|uniref:Uncharacterized protein n=1 Tax=Hypsizygus marmoreus TaxID=39966 RepID=A0A369K5A7_HYPMA|nr:hypothetical protein Hypma_002132 [Hypsizygus marmoreus]
MRTFPFLATVLLAVFTVITLAADIDATYASDSDYTPAEIQRNAQRKALGMPPIPPRALKKAKAAKKRAQKVQGVQVPLVTAKTSTGHITIHVDSVDGPRLGYLSNHKLVPYITNATEYRYTTTGDVTEIHVVDGNDSKMRMCVSTGLYGKSLGLGLKNFHLPRHTKASTAAGDVPFHDLRSASYLETSIFDIDPVSGEIEIEWVNPDGSRPPVQIALREERIYYTGDLSSFKEYLHGDNVFPVVFKWVHSEPQ